MGPILYLHADSGGIVARCGREEGWTAFSSKYTDPRERLGDFPHCQRCGISV